MKSKNWFLFILIGLIWGTSFLWIKVAVQEISPLVLVGFRTLFAALGLVVFLLIDRKSRMAWSEIKPFIPVFLVLGLVNVAIPWLLISWAEKHIETGVASILNATMPLWTIIISPLVISDDHINLP
jgi:drug/metabolite transporter (DMT)-like permease